MITRQFWKNLWGGRTFWRDRFGGRTFWNDQFGGAKFLGNRIFNALKSIFSNSEYMKMLIRDNSQPMSEYQNIFTPPTP